ncbi:hypothetical protein F5887DRAFT_920239 [Amanita rubescens]|nr:hypothetical protein F5887DRAFT_920239 [Amanita rubescens]
MVNTPIDHDLTLGDLMAVINEFRLSNQPVTVQTVIAALVARTNANCAACPAPVTSSHSERIPVLAALARTNAKDAARLETKANNTARLENVNRAVRPSSYSEHIPEPVPIRAPLAGTNANRVAHHEAVVPIPFQVPLVGTNANRAIHHGLVEFEPVPIQAPLVGTNVNRAAHHEAVVPLHSERALTRPSQAPGQSTYVQSNASRRRKRFYAVIVGRQTGVFDDWQFVKELTDQIPNNSQIGFTTEQQAFNYYDLQKDKGRVLVTWLSRAEELRYGPMSVALF